MQQRKLTLKEKEIQRAYRKKIDKQIVIENRRQFKPNINYKGLSIFLGILLLILLVSMITKGLLTNYKQKITLQAQNQTRNEVLQGLSLYQSQTGNIYHIEGNKIITTPISELCKGEKWN